MENIDLRKNPDSTLYPSQRSYMSGYNKGKDVGARLANGLTAKSRAEAGEASTIESQRQLEWKKRNNLTTLSSPLSNDLVAEFKKAVKDDEVTLRQALTEAVELWLAQRK
jgi:hypothetical protein